MGRAIAIINRDSLQLAMLWPVVIDRSVLCDAVVPKNDRTFRPLEPAAKARLLHMLICNVVRAPECSNIVVRLIKELGRLAEKLTELSEQGVTLSLIHPNDVAGEQTIYEKRCFATLGMCPQHWMLHRRICI